MITGDLLAGLFNTAGREPSRWWRWLSTFEHWVSSMVWSLAALVLVSGSLIGLMVTGHLLLTGPTGMAGVLWTHHSSAPT